MTSLSDQLKRLAVPQSQILEQDKKRVSLLFQPSEAAKLGAEIVFTLGLSGLDELCEIDETTFRPFEASLFSDTSQRIQRVVLSKEENQKLNENVEAFLVRITPYFLLRSAQKCLEWLTFRFYIHQYNVDSLLRLALPFHESNTFVRLIQILEIPENDSKWGWLIPFQKTQLSVRRQVLINRCVSEKSFLGFICETVAFYIDRLEPEEVSKIDVIFTFYVSVVIGTLGSLKSLENDRISLLIPYVAAGLKSDINLYRIASYMIVAQLAVQIKLEDSVVQSLLKALLSKLRFQTSKNGLTTAMVLCETQFIQKEVKLPKKGILRMIKKSESLLIVDHLESLSEQNEVRRFLVPVIKRCFEISQETEEADLRRKISEFTHNVLSRVKLSRTAASDVFRVLLEEFNECQTEETLKDDFISWMKGDLQTLAKRHPDALDQIFFGEKAGNLEAEFLKCFDLGNVSRMEVEPSTEDDTSGFVSEENKEEEPEENKEKKRVKKSKNRESKVDPAEAEKNSWWQKTVKNLEKQYSKPKADHVRELFTVLKECCFKDGDYFKKEYSMQLIMDSLKALCNDDAEKKKLKVGDFDVSVVVQCMKYSKSPQTHQAALRLLTDITALFKDEVMGHVMAVFTSIGSDMNKEDTYSFLLIQQALDAVVPAYLGMQFADEKEKLHRIVETLRIFVVCLNQVPSHRRFTLMNRVMLATRNPDGDVQFEHLWALVGLLHEQHVFNRKETKRQRLAEERIYGPKLRDMENSDLEFVLELCWKFPAEDQLYCCLMLLQYVRHLSENDAKVLFNGYPDLFVRENYEKTLLSYFQHTILVFIKGLLAGEGLISKIAELGDEESLKEEVGDVCEDLFAEALKCRNYANEQREMAVVMANDRDIWCWEKIAARAKEVLENVNKLLPATLCLDVIKGLLSKENLGIQKNALDLLNSKLLQNPTPFTLNHIPKLGEIVNCLCGWMNVKKIKNSALIGSIELLQHAALSLQLLIRVISPHNKRPIELILPKLVSVIHSWKTVDEKLVGNLCLCLGELVFSLGILCVAEIPSLLPNILEIIASEGCQENLLLLDCVLACLQKVIEALAPFLGPHVADIIATVSLFSSGKWSDKAVAEPSRASKRIGRRLLEIRKHLSPLDGRTLLPAVAKCYEHLYKNYPDSLEYLFSILNAHIKGLGKYSGTEELNETVNILTEALSLRSIHSEKPVAYLNWIEDEPISCVVQLSLKLSENSFRPLIFRLTEWAEQSRNLVSADLGLKDRERLITFHRLMTRLAEKLKNLFVLFAGQLVKMDTELLDQCNFTKTSANERVYPGKKSEPSSEKTDALLRSILEVLSGCCQYDTERLLITRERFQMLSQPLIDQLDNTGVPHFVERTENYLIPCLLNLISAAEDDSLLKPFNYALLMKTRSHKAKTKKAALLAAEMIYAKLREEVTPLLPETMPFLSEAMEDENEEVEAGCQKVIKVLEGLLGDSLQQYLT